MRGVSDTPCFAFRLTLVYPRAYGVDLGVVEVTILLGGDARYFNAGRNHPPSLFHSCLITRVVI